MDPRLLQNYNSELEFMRDMGAEFAKSNETIAARLGIRGGVECADPYVERLLEGFAFLAARVQLKIQEEFPNFCQQLLSMVYPDYLAPLPSMTVVQFQPDPDDSDLAEGFTLERGTALRSGLGAEMQTNCEFRTAHDVTLYPIEVAEAEYIGNRASMANLGISPDREVAAGIRIRIRTLGGLQVSELKLDELPLFLTGGGDLPLRLYEQILGHGCGLSLVSREQGGSRVSTLDKSAIQRFGFQPEQAIFNFRARSFDGYRLLREYFALPERFLFVNLAGLRNFLGSAAGESFDLVIHLGDRHGDFDKSLDADNFRPFCAPAANIFPKRADRIHLNQKESEFHVVPDRSKPMDFEVYQVLGVTGYGSKSDDRQKFLPFYELDNLRAPYEQAAFFAVRRKPRIVSSKQKLRGARSSYLGQEAFVSLVDANEAPYKSDLAQLSINTLCTNRDLPMHMPLGQKGGDFSLEVNAPVQSIQCVVKPTKPGAFVRESGSGETTVSGDYAWRVISHLALNYLSLMDRDAQEGAAALRELLTLYANYSGQADRQINGVLSVSALPVTRRLPLPGPISFGRGLEIHAVLEEAAFDQGGMYLFGAVLAEFFSKYVSINHVTETVVGTESGIEIGRWPVRLGTRPEL